MARAKKVENKEVTVDAKSIKKEVMAYVDSAIDERLEKVFHDKIKKEFMEEIDKANKKLIREKNRKILWRDILLILFFGVIVFLTYLLYTSHYFDSYFQSNVPREVAPIVENKNEEEKKEYSFEELKKMYGSYLDSYVLSSDSSYLESFYNGKLTKELMNYYTLNSMNFDSLEVEDDYQEIDEDTFLDTCSKLFVEDCSSVSFDYNGNKVRYLSKLESFLPNSLLEKSKSSIQREIIDIQVEGEIVKIMTLEAVIFDEQIFSVYPDEWIGEYYGESFSNYSEKLNKIVYVFQGKKLKSIEKELS